jgi:hypothetical protein
MISEFTSREAFTSANFGPWCSLVATLPSLERVRFGLVEQPELEDLRVLVDVEPLKELLRMPTLRIVQFSCFSSPMKFAMQQPMH